MKKKEIEKKLSADLSAATPHLWDKIDQRITTEMNQPVAEQIAATANGKEVCVSVRGAKGRFYAAIALLLVAVLTFVWCFFIRGACTPNDPPKILFSDRNFVMIDINPSVQIELGSDGKVKAVRALNDDALVLISGRDSEFIGLEAQAAADKVLHLALEMGVMDVNKQNNAMLVSAELEDKPSEELLIKQIRDVLKESFRSLGVYGVVLSEVSGGAEITAQAQMFGVTEAKMRLVLSLRAMGGSVTDAEIPTISVAQLYDRISDRAELLSEIGSVDLEKEYEELTEAAEELGEELLEFIEELFEQLEDFEDAEEDIEALEEFLNEIETAIENGTGYDLLFKNLYQELLHIAEKFTQISDMIDGVITQIEQALAQYENLFEQIELQKNAIGEKQNQMLQDNRDTWTSHQKPDDFEELFEQWLEQAESRYQNEWDSLKREWERDDD